MSQRKYDEDRPSIPAKIERELYDEYHHLCAICGKPGPRLQIHHIDENRENNNPLNLIPLCPNCHLMDQHNPTVAINTGVLRLFRYHKDPQILAPQFYPIFRRTRFLFEDDNDPNFAPCFRTLQSARNELVRFIAAFEKGDFYSDELNGLMFQQPPQVFHMNNPESDAYADKALAEFACEHWEHLKTVRSKVMDLIVEQLRYESWPIPSSNTSAERGRR